jgi:hypothetical protein
MKAKFHFPAWLAFAAMSAMFASGMLVSASPKPAAPVITNVARSRGFEVQLWMVDEQWEQMDAEDIPKDQYLTHSPRTGKVHAIFLMKNPALDDEGNSNVTARVVVRRPDGSILSDEKRVRCWTVRAPFPRNEMKGARYTTWTCNSAMVIPAAITRWKPG